MRCKRVRRCFGSQRVRISGSHDNCFILRANRTKAQKVKCSAVVFAIILGILIPKTAFAIRPKVVSGSCTFKTVCARDSLTSQGYI
jgi:hypothetical protein